MDELLHDVVLAIAEAMDLLVGQLDAARVQELLDAVVAKRRVDAVLEDEEAARVGMSVKTDLISTSPAAMIPGHRESYLVRIAEAVHRVMGFDPPITNSGSNNSSAALLAGISSISTGAGPCDGAHSLAENCEIEPLYKGIKKILLLEVALTGVQ